MLITDGVIGFFRTGKQVTINSYRDLLGLAEGSGSRWPRDVYTLTAKSAGGARNLWTGEPDSAGASPRPFRPASTRRATGENHLGDAHLHHLSVANGSLMGLETHICCSVCPRLLSLLESTDSERRTPY